MFSSPTNKFLIDKASFCLVKRDRNSYNIPHNNIPYYTLMTIPYNLLWHMFPQKNAGNFGEKYKGNINDEFYPKGVLMLFSI